MKNPLIKRIPREFKSDLGKYAVIFLFMVMLISLVSGFLVADNSMKTAYENGLDSRNVEDGHITFNKELSNSLINKIEEKAQITLYDLKYFEEETISEGKTTRAYVNRDTVNLECLIDGDIPVNDSEIAIDRLFAKNNSIKIGDEITLNNKTLTVSGFIALSDYSSLFENNTDMMLDSINFNVGIMTEKGWDSVNSRHISYNYAWKYNEPINRDDKTLAKEKSEAIIEVLKDVVTEYDMSVADESEIIDVEDFVPEYQNNAILFAGNDMSGDKAAFILFDYIVIAVLAFIFAVTTLNTISSESKVIGTLRASGYSISELTCHYLILPVLVTLIAGIIGNVLGYTVFKDIMANLYYNSYSLPTYKVLWNAEAFLFTTVIPLILMFIINFFVINSKIKLSPLKLLRHELSKKTKKKAFRLNTKIPFTSRFRLRVLFQNMPSYIVMIFGIILGAVVIIFGELFGTIFKDYKEEMLNSIICKYQYILIDGSETADENAEKYCLTEFNFKYKDYVKDSVSVYGIEDNSKYVSADIQNGKTAVSSTISKKYNIKKGDIITLSDEYSKDKSYKFTVDSIYDYDVSLSVFISREAYNQIFNKDENYFTGYFSNEELTDLDSESIASVITEKEYSKLSDQMEHSMGDMTSLFKYFGIIMYVLIMYILSKQVIEKNFQSIAMCKILGFKNSEIGMLYVLSTSIAVLIGLILAIPFSDSILRWTFNSYLYKVVSGYFPYIPRTSSFIFMFVLGLASYCIVAVLQLLKIRKISKSEALKNVE